MIYNGARYIQNTFHTVLLTTGTQGNAYTLWKHKGKRILIQNIVFTQFSTASRCRHMIVGLDMFWKARSCGARTRNTWNRQWTVEIGKYFQHASSGGSLICVSTGSYLHVYNHSR